MAQDFARAFYHSARWSKARATYLRTPVETEFGTCPPNMCELCFASGKVVPANTVHHKVHLTPENVNDPTVSLNPDNFQRLCPDCHAYLHSDKDEPRVSFGADGRVSARPAADDFGLTLHRLTATDDERRNFHRGVRQRGDERCHEG